MSDRLVVCFRVIDLDVEPSAYLRAARTLGERAAALGARLISWGATLYAFELESDAIQDAVELALSGLPPAATGESGCAAGVSLGPLETIDDATMKQPLRWGHALVRAAALARAAKAGEVLLDPSLPAIESGELVTAGSRVSLYGKLRIRGLLLNAAHPWRAASPASPAGFAPPPFVACGVDDIVGAGSGLVVIRAAAGYGGSRLLEEAAEALEPSRVLYVAPQTLGEPLGALRVAILRSLNANQAPAGLTSGFEQSLESLLAGEGLDPDSAAELLSAWLAPDAPNGPPGVVLVDDASRVDADTLDVVGHAVKPSSALRVVVRLAPSDSIPGSLAAIPVARETRLESLSTGQAEELASLAAGGDMDARTKAEWAVRGGRVPLGIVESVRESIEAGDIAWDEGGAIARGGAPACGPRPPAHWIRKRVARRDQKEMRMLEALAVLGGRALEDELASLVADRDPAIDFDKALAALVTSGWIRLEAPRFFALASATHRDVIVKSMNDADFAAWHRAAAKEYEKRDRPLAAASAAVHYVLAGDAERAREVARLAAAATRAIGLESTAKSFDGLSERDDIDALTVRNSFGSELQAGRQPRSRDSRPPRPSDPSRGSRRPRASASGSPSQPARSSEPDRSSVPPRASPPPGRAVEALRKGDAASVERLAQGLRVDETKSGLAERLQAMADLARGDTGDAIRRLRDGVTEAKRTQSRDQCRALLALAVGLASANRKEEALLEALDALARARESKDERGEHACLRFLAQLVGSAGHVDLAGEWAKAAGG